MIGRTLQLISRDTSTQEKIETNIPFNVNTQATYQKIDTAMRTLNSLTNNTYIDSLSINTVSVTEELIG